MANSKISALTAATTPVAGTEVLPIVQSSATVQVSIANLTAGRSVSMSAGTISSGNLTFSSTAQRIVGDMSNATIANRMAFQTSTVDGATRILAIPNGTGNTSAFAALNGSDANNASWTQISTNATTSLIQATISGTGTYLPMVFQAGGSERMRLDTSGNLGVGFSTVPDLLAAYSASAARFSVYGDGQTQINAFRYSTDASAPQVGLAKSRGTYAAPTAVASADQMASINFQAYGGTNRRTLANVTGFVDTYTSDTDISSTLRFGTSPSGSATATERLRINSSGDVLVTGTGTGSLGYGTGAGGTVTQGTSRTTGVTLSKPTGAITMFSAAGSVVAATFTVTNTLVAATDTIILNQKSGTNLYVLLVTAVAAGSFNITFYTTGGVATDAPVINFAIIKGVTA